MGFWIEGAAQAFGREHIAKEDLARRGIIAQVQPPDGLRVTVRLQCARKLVTAMRVINTADQ